MADAADLHWWQPFARMGRASVDYVYLTPNAQREAFALACLDAKETARWHRYRHPRPQRQFVLCRAALRIIICERLGCKKEDLCFTASRHGKPVALVRDAPASVQFNVSHSGTHGLIALSEPGRIGVDIEERTPRNNPDGNIAKAFAPRERRALAAAEGDRKLRLFFQLWTCKEALIKALGSGFSLDTSTFEIPPSMYLSCRLGSQRALFCFPHLPQDRWRLEDLGTDDFAAAVAHELISQGDDIKAAEP